MLVYPHLLRTSKLTLNLYRLNCLVCQPVRISDVLLYILPNKYTRLYHRVTLMAVIVKSVIDTRLLRNREQEKYFAAVCTKVAVVGSMRGCVKDAKRKEERKSAERKKEREIKRTKSDRGSDNLLACAHPKCAKSRRSAARAHCFLVCQVFRVLGPSGGHAIVTRSRATARQSRRSNALLLCIVLGQIKERGAR